MAWFPAPVDNPLIEVIEILRQRWKHAVAKYKKSLMSETKELWNILIIRIPTSGDPDASATYQRVQEAGTVSTRSPATFRSFTPIWTMFRWFREREPTRTCSFKGLKTIAKFSISISTISWKHLWNSWDTTSRPKGLRRRIPQLPPFKSFQHRQSRRQLVHFLGMFNFCRSSIVWPPTPIRGGRSLRRPG